MMPERTRPPAQQRSVVAIVKDAPRPKLADRGRLIGAEEVRNMLPTRASGKKVSRWWVNHTFLPAKRVKVGRMNAWWESDILAALDSGDLTE